MSLYSEIMNLREDHEVLSGLSDEQKLLYKIAFRDARHAAAELSLKYLSLDQGP